MKKFFSDLMRFCPRRQMWRLNKLLGLPENISLFGFIRACPLMVIFTTAIIVAFVGFFVL